MYKCARCNNRATVGVYCAKHDATPRKEPYRKPPTGGAVYKSPRWRALREQALSKQPLCQCCNRYGRVVPAVDVDHIYPISHSPTLSYSLSNMQCLCKSCHSRKTGYERQGIIYDYTMGRIINIDNGSINSMP